MALKVKGNIIGAWAFLIGVVIAILAAFVPQVNLQTGTWAGVFIAIGIIIGLLNVTGAELKDFLLAGAVLVIVGKFGTDVVAVLPFVGAILNALVLLFIPATIVVALKAVFAAARK